MSRVTFIYGMVIPRDMVASRDFTTHIVIQGSRHPTDRPIQRHEFKTNNYPEFREISRERKM
jgi:hypothetical protein